MHRQQKRWQHCTSNRFHCISCNLVLSGRDASRLQAWQKFSGRNSVECRFLQVVGTGKNADAVERLRLTLNELLGYCAKRDILQKMVGYFRCGCRSVFSILTQAWYAGDWRYTRQHAVLSDFIPKCIFAAVMPAMPIKNLHDISELNLARYRRSDPCKNSGSKVQY